LAVDRRDGRQRNNPAAFKKLKRTSDVARLIANIAAERKAGFRQPAIA